MDQPPRTRPGETDLPVEDPGEPLLEPAPDAGEAPELQPAEPGQAEPDPMPELEPSGEPEVADPDEPPHFMD